MFAIVRTGGKQYRVAAGDKIVVEKLAGEAGDSVDLTDILLAGEGSDLKSTSGLTVAAEIVAQAKADKVTVFKKRRRHNYRRKKGHRQQHTILRIVSIGDQKDQPKKKVAAKAEPAAASAEAGGASPSPATASAPAPAKTAKAPKPTKAAAAPETAATPSTGDAAPAKAAPAKAAKPAPKTKK